MSMFVVKSIHIRIDGQIISMFVVKSINIQIDDQVMDLSIKVQTFIL